MSPPVRVFADNRQAIRSYEKAGFRREGLLRDDVTEPKGLSDAISQIIICITLPVSTMVLIQFSWLWTVKSA